MSARFTRTSTSPTRSSRRSRASRIVAAAFAAATILGACGGGGSGRISTTAFITRADAVCRASETRLAPVLRRESLLTKPATIAAGIAALRQASSIVRDGVRSLRGLPQPSVKPTLLHDLYAALGSEATALAQYATDVKAKRAKAAKADANAITSYAQLYDRIAGQYGFRVCGHG